MYSELQEIKDLVGMLVNDKKKINDRLKRKIYKLVNKCMVQELNRGVVGKKQTVDRLEQIIPDLIVPGCVSARVIEPECGTASGMGHHEAENTPLERGVIMDDEG